MESARGECGEKISLSLLSSHLASMYVRRRASLHSFPFKSSKLGKWRMLDKSSSHTRKKGDTFCAALWEMFYSSALFMTNNVALYVKNFSSSLPSPPSLRGPHHSSRAILRFSQWTFLYHFFCASRKCVTRKLYNNRATFVCCHKWLDEKQQEKGKLSMIPPANRKGNRQKQNTRIRFHAAEKPRLPPENYCERYCNNIKESLYFIYTTSC